MSIPLLYLDTSAWLKLYVEEDGSEAVNVAVEQVARAGWAFAPPCLCVFDCAADPHSRRSGQRLEAIESLEELRIGFTLATHALEIRGAGELLGEGQSAGY